MKEKFPKNRKGRNYLYKAAFWEARQNAPLREDKARKNLKSLLTMLTRLLQLPVMTPDNLSVVYRQFLH